MANFNSSYWYHLYVNQNDDVALTGTNLSIADNTRGTSFFTAWGTKNATQKWQWYGVSDSTYVLRCKGCGPDAFLSTKFEPKETTPGQTQSLMMRGNISDDSVFWSVSPWGDGTFFLTNKQNGTDWHLNKKGDGGLSMSSNLTAPQNGQRWSFHAVEPITNETWSTVDLPSLSTEPPTNPTGTPVDVLSSSPSPSPSSGMSTGAKAGIGAGVGLVALIALVVLGLFLWRRKQNRKHIPYSQDQKTYPQGYAPPAEMGDASRQEMGDATQRLEMGRREAVKYGHRSDVTYEMPDNGTVNELPSQSPVELPNSTVSPNAR